LCVRYGDNSWGEHTIGINYNRAAIVLTRIENEIGEQNGKNDAADKRINRAIDTITRFAAG
jgi:hypothetical protein